jgi:YHS domain-containing protein
MEALMKRWITASAVLVALLTVSVYAADEVDLKGVKCPVSGEPVKADKTLEYKGAKIYFCCENCPKKFDAKNKLHAAKANMQLVQTKQATEEKCPIAGKDLNPETAIEVSGVKVCFCCNGCKGKVTKAKGDEQIEMVFGDDAFKKGFKVVKK